MNGIDKHIFRGLLDRDSNRTFEELEIRNSYFEGCGLSITRSPKLRTTARNVRLLNCEQRGCGIESAIFDAVTVDGPENEWPIADMGRSLQTRYVARQDRPSDVQQCVGPTNRRTRPARAAAGIR